MAESPRDVDGLGLAELKSLLLQAYERIARQDAEIVALREEIARLKGLKGRPQLKPSGMEKSTEAPPKGKRKPGRRGAKRSKLTINETKIIEAENIQAGARFKGYEDFIVQDIVVQPRTVLYRRERWQLPSGETVVAPLPAGTVGHFGPELRRFAISQYVQGQVTVPRLAGLLNDVGVVISKRQVMRLLIEGQDAFLTEAKDVLREGLSSAAWITVDDTSLVSVSKCQDFCGDRPVSSINWAQSSRGSAVGESPCVRILPPKGADFAVSMRAAVRAQSDAAVCQPARPWKSICWLFAGEIAA